MTCIASRMISIITVEICIQRMSKGPLFDQSDCNIHKSHVLINTINLLCKEQVNVNMISRKVLMEDMRERADCKLHF